MKNELIKKGFIILLTMIIFSATITINSISISDMVTQHRESYTTNTEISGWNVTLHFSEPVEGCYDDVKFGEHENASDGLDNESNLEFDMPKPPYPPPPFLYAFLKTEFEFPYNHLLEETKHYPDSYKLWNLTVQWFPTDNNPTNVTISWDVDELNVSEYNLVTLENASSETKVDMFANNNYTFTCPAFAPKEFKIICIKNLSTVYVDDDYNESTLGWDFDHFDNIQDGIDVVDSDGTVIVYNGTYFENIDITKSINLVGEDKNTTILDGGKNGNVVNITSDLVTVNGFTIQNSSFLSFGIDILADESYIFDNIICNNSWGINIHDSSDNNEISNNILYLNDVIAINLLSLCNGNTISENNISNNGEGVTILDCKNNIVTNNKITSNNGFGVCLLGPCDENIISENIISLNLDGIHINSGMGNIISGNTITSNSENGIQLTSTDNIIVTGNYISNNEVGIYISGVDNDNTIFHNNLINNTENACDLDSDTWYSTQLNEGNYWDDYSGIDENQDGLGDTPYDIPGGDNQDLYPLMNPFELYYILDISIPSQKDEGNELKVAVRTEGGSFVSNATVEFNDELKITDSNGTVTFTTPQVDVDTVYNITATKDGYTSCLKTIIIIDTTFEKFLMIGRITNLSTEGEFITFESIKLRTIKFLPFEHTLYTEGLKIFLKDYKGLLGAMFGVEFIFALCTASIK